MRTSLHDIFSGVLCDRWSRQQTNKVILSPSVRDVCFLNPPSRLAVHCLSGSGPMYVFYCATASLLLLRTVSSFRGIYVTMICTCLHLTCGRFTPWCTAVLLCIVKVDSPTNSLPPSLFHSHISGFTTTVDPAPLCVRMYFVFFLSHLPYNNNRTIHPREGLMVVILRHLPLLLFLLLSPVYRRCRR